MTLHDEVAVLRAELTMLEAEMRHLIMAGEAVTVPQWNGPYPTLEGYDWDRAMRGLSMAHERAEQMLEERAERWIE